MPTETKMSTNDFIAATTASTTTTTTTTVKPWIEAPWFYP